MIKDRIELKDFVGLVIAYAILLLIVIWVGYQIYSGIRDTPRFLDLVRTGMNTGIFSFLSFCLWYCLVEVPSLMDFGVGQNTDVRSLLFRQVLIFPLSAGVAFFVGITLPVPFAKSIEYLGEYLVVSILVLNLGCYRFAIRKARKQHHVAEFHACIAVVVAGAEETIKWIEKVAEMGDAEAQYEAGSRLWDNHAWFDPRSEKAVEWWRKAAEQGHAKAQFRLGSCYAKGQGVSANDVEAYMWFDLVAQSDGKRRIAAKEECDRIGSKMTPEQIAEAQKLSREWKPKK